MELVYTILFILLFISCIVSIILFRKYRLDNILGKGVVPISLLKGISMYLTDTIYKKHTKDGDEILYRHRVKIISYILIIFLICNGCGAVYLIGHQLSKNDLIQSLTRPNVGEGDNTITVMTENESYTGPMDITIDERVYTFDETMEIFNNYRKDFDALVLGDNSSFLHVISPLHLPSVLGKENISVSWNIADTDIIDYNGKIGENIPDSGAHTDIIATWTLGEISADICYYVKVFPPVKDAKTTISEYIHNQINSESNKHNSNITLPDTINGTSIKYSKYKESLPPITFLFVFFCLSIFVVISEKKDYARLKKYRQDRLKDDYPTLVNKLSLLTTAGLNIRHALERIVSDYSSTSKDFTNNHPAYDEIANTCSQIRNGIYEPLAYQQLGIRCGLPCYTKLTSYMVTGLKRGGQDFNQLLAHEANNALLEQKANILQNGQRASTKLMGPMMLLFVVIMCLVMIPAFLSMSM